MTGLDVRVKPTKILELYVVIYMLSYLVFKSNAGEDKITGSQSGAGDWRDANTGKDNHSIEARPLIF